MEKATITLKISSDVADRAEEAGILTDDRMERLILAELQRKERARQFFESIDAIAAVESRLTQEEIDAEIEAHRAEKRGSA